MAKQKSRKTSGKEAKGLPRYIQVGCHRVPIVRKEIPDKEACAGYFTDSPDGLHIAIDSRLSGSRETEVFLHELIHAVDHICGGADLAHRHVNSLAAGLTTALKPYLRLK